MAWSLTAPTLPSGSSWVNKGTISIPNNQLDVTGTVFCARLADQGFALKIVETRTFHLTNPNFTDFYKTYHRCDVAGVTGNAYTESDFGDSGSTKTYYFTGIAAPGASIKVIVGVKADNATQEISFTAPALLDGGDSGGGSSGGGTGGGDSGGGSSGGGTGGGDSGTTDNWTTTAPSLPNGSSWVQKGTTSVDQNNLTLATTVSCARLTGNRFAIRVAETRNVYTTNLTDFFKYYHRCDVGSTTGTASTGNWLNVGNNNTTQYFYYTGTAAPGTKITITIGVASDRPELMKTVTFTAPALLDGGDSGGGSSGGGTGGDSGGGSTGGDSGTTGNWTTTAPSLPSGSSWAQKDTIYISNNQLDVRGTVFFARLADRGFALKIVETRTFHLTNPNFTDFYKTYHRCDVAGVTGEAYTESDFGNSGSTKTYYFTGIAEAGASIKVIIGVKVDNSVQEISFTASALLGPTVYIKVGGTWKQASKVYVKSSGAWKEGQLKIKTGGAWK